VARSRIGRARIAAVCSFETAGGGASDARSKNGVRPGGRRFLDKIAQGAAQRVLIEITGTDNIEAGRLERLCDQARIVGRRRKRSNLIAGVADDERNAFFSPCGARREDKHERDQRKRHRDQLANPRHDIPHPKRKRACSRSYDTAALNGI